MRAEELAQTPALEDFRPKQKPERWRWARIYRQTCVELADSEKMRVFWTMVSDMDDKNLCAFNVIRRASEMGLDVANLKKLLKALKKELKVVYLKKNLWMISPRLVYSGHYAAWNLECWRFDERLKGNLGALYPTKETPNEPCDLQTGSPDADAPAGDSDALAQGGS